MYIFEVILEILGRIFVEFIFEAIIMGIYRLIKRFIAYLNWKLFGVEMPVDPIKALEKKLLYKKIELTKPINSRFTAGQKGLILEVINRKRVFVEFHDHQERPIEWKGRLVFKIRTNQFKLLN